MSKQPSIRSTIMAHYCRDRTLRLAFVLVTLLSCNVTYAEDTTILGTFNTEEEAKTFVSQLPEQTTPADIITVRESILLKTLTVGPYRTQRGANRVSQRLNNHQIDNWIRAIADGRRFLVHAGAIHDDGIYQDRYRKLAELGFKNIQSTLVPYPLVRFRVTTKTQSNTPVEVAAPTVFDQEIDSTRGKVDYQTLRKQSLNGVSYWSTIATQLDSSWKTKRWEFHFGATVQFGEVFDQSAHYYTRTGDLLPTFAQYRRQNQSITAGAILAADPARDPLLAQILNRKTAATNPLDPETPRADRTQFAIAWKNDNTPWQTQLTLNPVIVTDYGLDVDQPWHFVDIRRGKILERDMASDVQTILQNGQIDYGNKIHTGGGSVQVTHVFGKTRQTYLLSYSRRSTPYLELLPSLQTALQQGTAPQAALAQSQQRAFRAIYPQTWDIAFSETDVTSQYALALSLNRPLTLTDNRTSYAPQIDWHIASTPKRRWLGLKSTFAVGGRHFATDKAIRERKNAMYHRGSITRQAPNQDFTLSLHYHAGLDAKEVYLQPTFIYDVTHEFTVHIKSYLFYGDKNTTAGFYGSEPRIAVEFHAAF